MPSTNVVSEIPFLVITCLRWTSDGELCAEDQSILLHRHRAHRLGAAGRMSSPQALPLLHTGCSRV